MARIAFAWELGGSIGHVMSCAGLARPLAERGHAIAMMMRERGPLALVPETSGYHIFQAPRARHEGLGDGRPVSYAEILLGTGYQDPAEAARLLSEWLQLLSAWKPDLLVADFAPTALLAARTLGIRRATYGNGFFTPPRLSPLPPFRVDDPPDPPRVAKADAEVLATVNAALAQSGAPPLERLCDMFETDEDFLCTFPELDHYGSRPRSGYWGPRLRTDLGNPIDWPEARGKRILVYVQRRLPQLDALVDVLAKGPHAVMAYIPELEPARRERLRGRSRLVLDRPIRLDLAFRQCDLLVCHAGDIAAGALASGVPVMMFPAHYEQFLTSKRIELSGAGGWFSQAADAASVQAGMNAMTTQPRFAEAARAYARRYPAWSPREQRRRIVARIEALLATSRASPILTPSSQPESP